MTKKQNKKNCEINAISALLKLIQKNVPALLIWDHKGHVKHMGSKSLSDWFDGLDNQLLKNLQSRMVEDVINISDKTEQLMINPEDVPDHVRASSLYITLMTPQIHTSGIPLLPFPLEYMSKKEMIKYLSEIMRSEAAESQKKVVYGSQNFVPGFWLEADWPWTSLKQPLSKTKESMFTGDGSFSEFLAKTIRVMLESKGLEQDTHVEEQEGKGKQLEKKKRALGIHEGTKIIRTGHGRDDQNNHVCQDTIAQQTGRPSSYSQPQEDITSFSSHNDTHRSPQHSDLSSYNQQSDLSSFTHHSDQSSFTQQNSFTQHSDLSSVTEHSDLSSVTKDSDLSSFNQQSELSSSSQQNPFYDGISTSNSYGRSNFNPQSIMNTCSEQSGVKSAFKPRRSVGVSPFKVPSNKSTEKIKIPMTDHDNSGKVSQSPKIVDLPHQVVGDPFLVGCKQEWNTGGGSCLYKAAAQHIRYFGMENTDTDVSFVELRRFAHRKLIEWWPSFQPFFNWPLRVCVGTGDRARWLEFENAVQYKQFLLSDESLHAFSETEMDLWILSYVLNTTVWALTYNLPLGQGDYGGRCRWQHFFGRGASQEISKFSCRPEPLYILNEHLVHWSRIVGCDVYSDAKVAEEEIMESDESSPSVSQVSSPSGPKRKGLAPFPKSSRPESDLAQKAKQSQKRKSLVKKSDQSKKLKPNSKPNSAKPKVATSSKSRPARSSAQSKCGEKMKGKKQSQVRILQIKHRRGGLLKNGPADESFKVKDAMRVEEAITDIGDQKLAVDVAVKLDYYHSFVIKQPSLEDILRVPSELESAESDRLDKLCQDISERKDKSDAEVAASDKRIEMEKARVKLRRKNFRENLKRRNRIEEELSEPKMKEMFNDNKSYIERIHSGAEYSLRYDAFVKGGRSRDALRDKMITSPFKDDQVDFILDEIHQLLGLTSKQEEFQKSNYVWMVLLPECLIKVMIVLKFKLNISTSSFSFIWISTVLTKQRQNSGLRRRPCMLTTHLT